MHISLSARAWKDHFSPTNKNDSLPDSISRFSAFLPELEQPEQKNEVNSSRKKADSSLAAYAVPLVQPPILITPKKPATNSDESKERRRQHHHRDK
ncbi:MAG: hypothetical protein ACI89U_002808 [Gammaproteobacteria bacterium]|jgi:hypothetical protein